MLRTDRTATVLLGILTTVLVGWTLHIGAGILQPLVIAILLTTLLQPVVRALARLWVPPAVTVILLASLLFFGLAQMGIVLNQRIQAFVDPLTGWAGIIDQVKVRFDDPANSQFDALMIYLLNAAKDVQWQRIAGDLVGSGFDFTKGLFLVVIYMLFLFAEQAVFKRKILAIAGEHHDDAAEVLTTIGRGLQRYLGVKTVISLMTGVLCYAVLQALEIPFALLFGFLTFLLNYIPTFGSIIAGCFPTLTALATGDSPAFQVTVVIATYLAVNITLGSVIEPKILGRELNLSPLIVVLSVVVWAGLWGVVGAFLAVPLTAAAQIVLASQETTRPLAVMLSSGPPREDGLLHRIGRGRREREDEAPAGEGEGAGPPRKAAGE